MNNIEERKNRDCQSCGGAASCPDCGEINEIQEPERMKEIINVKLDDGKYQVLMGQDHRLKALRNGEDWRDLCGDNLVYFLASEVQKLRKIIKDAQNCLVCAAISNPVEVCENTLEILKNKKE